MYIIFLWAAAVYDPFPETETSESIYKQEKALEKLPCNPIDFWISKQHSTWPLQHKITEDIICKMKS